MAALSVVFWEVLSVRILTVVGNCILIFLSICIKTYHMFLVYLRPAVRVVQMSLIHYP